MLNGKTQHNLVDIQRRHFAYIDMWQWWEKTLEVQTLNRRLVLIRDNLRCHFG